MSAAADPPGVDADALLARLRPGLSPAALALLAPLVRHARLTEEPGAVLCTFEPAPDDDDDDDARVLRILSPGAPPPPGAPPSLAELFAVCGGLELGTPGETGQRVLHDGFSGTLHVVGEDAWNARRCGAPYDAGICAPIDVDLQSFYFLHPLNGRLCYHDSEGTCDVVRDTRDPVEIYLLEVHERARHAGWRLPALVAGSRRSRFVDEAE